MARKLTKGFRARMGDGFTEFTPAGTITKHAEHDQKTHGNRGGSSGVSWDDGDDWRAGDIRDSVTNVWMEEPSPYMMGKLRVTKRDAESLFGMSYKIGGRLVQVQVSDFGPSPYGEQRWDVKLDIRVDDKPAGTSHRVLNQKDKAVSMVWLGIDPQFKRTGIGTTLIRLQEHQLAKAGFEKLWLEAQGDGKAVWPQYGYSEGYDKNTYVKTPEPIQSLVYKHATHDQKSHGNWATGLSVMEMREWVPKWAAEAPEKHRMAVTEAIRRWKASPGYLREGDEYLTALRQAIDESPVADFELARGTSWHQFDSQGMGRVKVGDEIEIKRDTGWSSIPMIAAGFGDVVLTIPGGSVKAFPVDDMVVPQFADQYDHSDHAFASPLKSDRRFVPMRNRMKNIERLTLHDEGEFVAKAGKFRVTDVSEKRRYIKGSEMQWHITIEPVT